MRHLLTALTVLLAIGCSGDEPTDTSTDTDTEDTGPSDTIDTSTVDTGTTGPTVRQPLTKPGWGLHPVHGSVAYVAWEQAVEEDVHVEYSFDKGVWLSSPSKPATVGLNERTILGIPYGSTAQWRVVSKTTTQDFGKDPILTEAVPQRLPTPLLRTADAKAWWPDGKYLLTSLNSNDGGWTQGRYFTVIFDRQGRYVWANQTPERHWTLYAQVANAGDHIMWDEATYWADWDDGAGSKIHRQYLDETNSFEVIDAEGLHHAWIQLPDGTLAWGSQFHRQNQGTEALVELAPGATEATVLWNCRDDWPTVAFCESNSLFYDAKRDTYLYSFYTNNSMVEIDRKAGTTRWWAGAVKGGLAFLPKESQFFWQHGVSWTDARTLLVSTDAFQNGDKVTMLREYTLDEKSGSLTEVWAYNEGILAGTNGAARRLPNGNTLHIVGAGGVLYEVDAKGEVVWKVDVQDDHLLGDGEFIDDLYTLLSPKAP
ncbi:MAG: hypothetical protein KTR31_25135 [Myxococcales bacterium]|nr:hypothetical protein [Myxococcales bacterium]